MCIRFNVVDLKGLFSLNMKIAKSAPLIIDRGSQSTKYNCISSFVTILKKILCNIWLHQEK